MNLNKVEDLYKAISRNNENAEFANSILEMQDWFISLWEYEPTTNEPMPSDLDEILYRISLKEYLIQNQPNDQKRWYCDRLQKIINYSAPAIFQIFEYFHEKQIREHLISRPEKTRQYDSEAIRYLSKKPGKTIKQKIAMNQHKVMGVFHNTSFDTLENRLFKAYIKKLDIILYEKEKAFGFSSMPDSQKSFNSRIHKWLQEEIVQDIGELTNLTPNNVLLNDKNYRKILNSWIELLRLDDCCKKDIELYEKGQSIIKFWRNLSLLNLYNGFNFKQQPVIPQIDSSTGYLYLTISPYIDDIDLRITNKNGQELGNESFNFTTDSRIDINKYEKKYPNNSKKEFELREKKEQKAELVVTDFVQLRPAFLRENGEAGNLPIRMRYQFWKDYKNVKSKTVYDIQNFYSANRYDKDDIFSCQVTDFFKDDYLSSFSQMQDCKNFSEVEKTNYSIKAANYFAKGLAKGLNAKNCIYLLPDNTDDFSPIQKAFRNNMNINFQNASPLPRSIAAIFTKQKQFAESNQGYKSGTTVYLYDKSYGNNVKTKIEVKYDKKLETKNPETKGIYYERFPCEVIKSEDAVSVADSVVINIGKNICEGALYLEKLQEITPDIPLWKDHLPLLYIKIPVNEKEENFYLVGKNTPPIQPKKGIARPIEIENTFTFPASGVEFYEFPLVQGEKQNTKKYYAYITNGAFPLTHDVECKLSLTYTYGEEIPYELKFISLDNEIKFVAKVRWETESHVKPWDLSAPSFIPETTWQELYHFPRRTPTKYGDTHSDLIRDWLPDQFSNIVEYYRNGYCANTNFRSGLRFPALSFWKFGRSIFDDKCPKTFRQRALLAIVYAYKIYTREVQANFASEDKDEMFYFLSCAAKDIPEEKAQELFLHLTKQQLQVDTYKKSCGYALGDLSREWQEELLENLLKSDIEDIDILYIISIAIWRSKEFVYKLSANQIIEILKKCLKELQKNSQKKYDAGSRNLVVYESIILEVVLGLLRARRTIDGKIVQNEEVAKCLCSEFNPVIKKLPDAINNAENRRRAVLFTRIKFDGNITLVDAVKTYLSSKKKVHAIKITKVLDAD